MSTRSVSTQTIKRLFAESKGICAKCDDELFPEGDNVAEICHIEAYSSGGNRYNENLKKIGKENHYNNLLILCSKCHKIIDLKSNEKTYDVTKLKLLKEDHLKKSISKSPEKLDKGEIIDTILDKFYLSIENELAEIKKLLSSLTGNNCFESVKEKFKNPKKFRPSFENINSFYFSNADKEIIETIKAGIEIGIPQSYILEGPPSSGKTTLIIKLASELPQSHEQFYISLLQDYSIDSIRRDIRSIQNFHAIVYIDECHINNNFACEIYNSCCDYSNLTLVFLYRDIENTSKTSDDGDNLFENNATQLFKINPFDNQNEKIITLIKNRGKAIFKKTNNEAEVGDINVIYNTINKNLLKLSLLLDEWEKHPNIPLEKLNDKELNKLLFKRFLNTRYNKDEISFLKIYTTINTYEIPFRILDSTNLEAQLSIDALINKTEDDEFEFFHSSFSNLLLLSILSNDSTFNLEYPDGFEQFLQTTFKIYFSELSQKSAKRYPDKLIFSFTKLLANGQFKLYKFLVRDKETKQQIINYFNDVTDINQYSLFFRQISKSSSNLFEFYYSKLIHVGKIKEILKIRFKDISDLRIVLELLRNKSYDHFKNAINKLSISERKKILLSSPLNSLVNSLQYIINLDSGLANFLDEGLSQQDWLNVLNQNSLPLVVKSMFVLKELRGISFIDITSTLLDKKKIKTNSRFESIEKLSKSIKELARLNGDLAEWFASSISENEIIEKIKNQPIDKISKSFKELVGYKPTEIYTIIDGFNDDYLFSEFRKKNLSVTGKVLSDFFDINDAKIKNIVSKQEFQNILLSKLSIETDAGQVAKIIADLKKIEPESAKLFISQFTFDKIQTLIDNANLQQLGEFINNIFSVKEYEKLSEEIFISIPSNIIASKVLNKDFKFTNYEAPFLQLSNVNWDKTIEILELIDNDLIAQQAGGHKPYDVPTDYARKVSSTLKSLNDLVPKKIKKITLEIFKLVFFDKKINDLSKTDLVHCYANFAAINNEYATNKFKERVENLTTEDIKNESISKFSDGLRLLREPLELIKDSFIIKSFESHLLTNYKNFTLAQISVTFMNLYKIDKIYSANLITNLDLKFIVEKTGEMKDGSALASFLGEILTVNPLFHKKLIKEIGNQKNVKK